MQRTISISVLPREAADENGLRQSVCQSLAIAPARLSGFIILRRSLDARGRLPRVRISLKAFIDEPFQSRQLMKFNWKEVQTSAKRVLIIGAGPAGLFAALKLIEAGIQPILIERGKEVRARRRDLAILNKEGILNPESNYCFGEGGAGTYSDGKLYTRSTKRGDLDRILNIFVHFGAEENILYESHPHIGTNKLPGIISAMRKQILACGGQFLFEKKLTDLLIKGDRIAAAQTIDGDRLGADAFLLATGHSARDIFELLHAKKVSIEFKPFALGVRAEHPQALIDAAQYHLSPGAGNSFLPPASYSLVRQVEGKAVFSFCMCPGGIIAPAATSQGELVVNGWSPSKRNNPFANSGIVVPVDEKDLRAFAKQGPLAGLRFQQAVEQKAYLAGGGKFVAPAQRITDFVRMKPSASLPRCSYLPGVREAELNEIIPAFISQKLRKAFVAFDRQLKGYLTAEALLVATESRTSSPCRIPRDPQTLQHPQIRNLYPCGEGAGYAGGIVSAAMDGEKVAEAIILRLAGGPLPAPKYS